MYVILHFYIVSFLSYVTKHAVIPFLDNSIKLKKNIAKFNHPSVYEKIDKYYSVNYFHVWY